MQLLRETMGESKKQRVASTVVEEKLTYWKKPDGTRIPASTE
jgi:hypothetical protein